jgi:deoxyhypusine monooxygenase
MGRTVYTTAIVKDEAHSMDVMGRMEDAFQRKDEKFIVKVVEDEPSLVLRVHAVCILAEIGGAKSTPVLSDVLLHDPDPLVRHEAAFSLGQIGLSRANRALQRAVMTDRDPIVRHEAAAALGSIGNASAEKTLRLALKDRAAIVRNSAKTSLFNLEFLRDHAVGSNARERAPRP